MQNDRQLFVLPKEVWGAVAREESIATIRALRECGLLHPPFKEFDIRAKFTTRQIMTWITGEDFDKNNPDGRLDEEINNTYRYSFDNPNDPEEYSYKFRISYNGNYVFCGHNDEPFLAYVRAINRQRPEYPFSSCLERISEQVTAYQSAAFFTLMTLLSTKNATKKVDHFKSRSASSRKKSHEYATITTISIGKITNTMRTDDSSGSSVTPHLRRGHIRNQRFGEGLKEVRKLFIHPVFVNADKDWIKSEREEYRIKM